MGSCLSSQQQRASEAAVEAAKAAHPPTPTQRRSRSVAQQLVDAVKSHGSEVRVRSLDALLLKLPSVRDEFSAFKSLFLELAAGRLCITRPDLATAVSQLGLVLAPDVLDGVFSQADTHTAGGSHSSPDSRAHSADFKQFCALLVLCWLLRAKQGPAGPAVAPPSTRLVSLDKALSTLLEAWFLFDAHNRGWVCREDVDAALGTDVATDRAKGVSSSSGGSVSEARRQVTSRRFAELDFKKDGRINFAEFVGAVEDWAGVDDGEEEEEVEGEAATAAAAAAAAAVPA